eukprot:1194372-Prorocentrum_minimum.AAC.6
MYFCKFTPAGRLYVGSGKGEWKRVLISSFLSGTMRFSCLEAAFTCFASACLMWAPGKISENAFSPRPP